MEYFLRTRRLAFRCWREDDLPLALDLWGDPRVTALIGGPFSPETAQARLAQEIAQQNECGMQYWPVFLPVDLPAVHSENYRHAGCAGLRPTEKDKKIYELGIHLRPAFWGQGLALEAGSAVIQLAFGALAATALVAGHHPLNLASRKVILSLGFNPTGLELYPPTGLMHPMYRLGQPLNHPK